MMVTTWSDLTFRSYMRQLPKQLLRGFLQIPVGVLHELLCMLGLRRRKTAKWPGAYWARDQFGRWELRVPARSLHESPPA